jgi:CheY-specific phosphatase CheX
MLSAGQTSSAPAVIRLRVVYRTAEALVTEYTACLTRGGCLLAAHKSVDVGSVFVFEMTCADTSPGMVGAVEVQGEVVRVRPIYGATLTYELAVQYRTTGAERPALNAMLAKIEVARGYTVVREFPRIPVNLPAEDSRDGGRYVVRDISRGGMCVEALASCDVEIGTRVLLAVRLCAATAPLSFIGGTVRWKRPTSEATLQAWIRFAVPVGAQFGVEFDEFESLSGQQQMVIDELTGLVRPHHVFLHLTGQEGRRRSPGDAAPEGRRLVNASEVSAVVVEIAKQKLSIALGLSIVDAEAVDQLGSSSHTARVAITGDLVGEIEMRASVDLCAAIAAQISGDEVAVEDQAALEDALCEFVVSLAGEFCDRLEISGHEVSITVPLAGDEPNEAPGDRVHAVSLAGPRGAVMFIVRVYGSRRATVRLRAIEAARLGLLES